MPFQQPSRQVPDGAIIHQLLQDDGNRQRGEDQLFSQYIYFIGQAMHKYSFAEEEAFDVYADTIIAGIAMIRSGAFEGRSSIKTWLYQIFHHKCVDLIRKKSTNKNSVHRVVSIADMLLQLTDTARSVVQTMIDNTDMELVRQKLKETGTNCGQVLLQWAEGANDKEIAIIMNYKNADVVKTTRLRCMEKLRQLYKEHKISQP